LSGGVCRGRQVAEVESEITALEEANPMMGFRGCRLSIRYPEISRMQVRAMMMIRRVRRVIARMLTATVMTDEDDDHEDEDDEHAIMISVSDLDTSGWLQVRAILTAALEAKRAGSSVTPEIMIPLVCTVKELEPIIELIRDEAKQVSPSSRHLTCPRSSTGQGGGEPGDDDEEEHDDDHGHDGDDDTQ
jgi:signal transduction protein with GAF and PtsI domain